MAKSKRTYRDLVSTYGLLIFVVLAGFVVTWQFVEPAPPRQLTMATGSPDGAYHRFGIQYQAILARHGIRLELLNTAGSVENLKLLNDPKGTVDVAFLQGGVGVADDASQLNALASVFHEPVWIFRQSPFPVMVGDFVGQRIAIGAPGSGTRFTMDRLFEYNELSLSSFVAVELGGDAAADALLSGDIDVAGFVASESAPYIGRLLAADDINLVSFIRAEAYMRRFDSLARVVLPRGAADLRRDIPKTNIEMLAPIASLTAKSSLHPTLALLLMQAAIEIHSESGLFQEDQEFPSVHNTVFPINKETRRYLEKGPPFLQRYLPFWIAVTLDRLLVLVIPLITLLIPLFKIAPPTYRWRVRRRIYTNYQYLFEIDNVLAKDPSIPELDQCIAQIDRMDEELNEINVPLSYADQFYHLRMHIRFVRQKVEHLRG